MVSANTATCGMGSSSPCTAMRYRVLLCTPPPRLSTTKGSPNGKCEKSGRPASRTPLRHSTTASIHAVSPSSRQRAVAFLPRRVGAARFSLCTQASGGIPSGSGGRW